MNIKLKQLLSTLLAATLILSLFVAITPLTAYALTLSELATHIGSFNHGGNGSLSAVATGNNITVTGNVTGAKNQLELDMPANSRLDWKASYTGSALSLIKLSGLGLFSVEMEGSIVNNIAGLAIAIVGGGPTVTINGGTASTINGIAINAADSRSNITIESGNVSATSGAAISANGGNSSVTVRGGTVIATTGFAVAINGANSSVKVDGGMISATSGTAIGANGAGTAVTVNGGTVSGAGQSAISVAGTGATVSINGGFVFAYGTEITGGDSSVINMASGSTPAIGGKAVVSAWDKPGGTPAYTAGSNTNLIVSPSSAAATWAKNGSQNGISYANGTNTGFLPIDGVTVNADAAFTVAFNSNGGSAVSSQSIAPGGKAVKPADPARTGYAFDGWYADAEFVTAYNFDNTITTDITLYAKWTETGSPLPLPSASPSMSNFVKIRTYTHGMFADVNEGAWYGFNQQKSIANAYEYGLMQGNGPTVFNPTGNITIAEAITVAARVHRIYSTGADDLVQSGSPWYKVYVDYAMENGIIAASTFTDYNRAATRAEMAYVFSAALPATQFAWQNTVNSLPDVNSSTPYRDAIFMLYKAGVLTGNDEKGTFSPGNSIIRAESAAIISRVILPSMRISGNVF